MYFKRTINITNIENVVTAARFLIEAGKDDDAEELIRKMANDILKDTQPIITEVHKQCTNYQRHI